MSIIYKMYTCIQNSVRNYQCRNNLYKYTANVKYLACHYFFLSWKVLIWPVAIQNSMVNSSVHRPVFTESINSSVHRPVFTKSKMGDTKPMLQHGEKCWSVFYHNYPITVYITLSKWIDTHSQVYDSFPQ